MFNWPYSGKRMRRFTSKNYVFENFDVMGIQRRFASSFPDEMLFRNCPTFNFKEKSRGYSVYSCFRTGSIKCTLRKWMFQALALFHSL